MNTDELPQARMVKKRGPNPIWLVPLVIIGVVGWVLWSSSKAWGPEITVRFDTTPGLREGDAVRYRGVRIGEVRDIRLAQVGEGVEVTAAMTPDATDLLREGSLFWIVRPEVSLERISGLETIVGPHYVRFDPGPGGAPASLVFDGLSVAPDSVESPSGAVTVELLAARRGSIGAGSPVTHRDIEVGRVTAVGLTPDMNRVRMTVMIDPDHAFLVRENTRFWNASGIGVEFGLFAGLSVQADSLESVLTGGVAFATPTRAGRPAADAVRYRLEPEAPEGWARWAPQLERRDP